MSRLADLPGFLGTVPLRYAQETAPAETGVYRLYLDGELMKVGKATYKGGLRWRLKQYWNGHPDTAGPARQIIQERKDDVRVSWTLCTRGECRDLETAMFDEAGGAWFLPWAVRR